jgi:HK97 family phage portal protein
VIKTGFLDLFKPKPKKEGLYFAPTSNGGLPFYTSFGENVYASDIIVQSIRCKANEFKKLDPRHIRLTDGTKTLITDSSIARVLKRPNAYMTTADFLEKITILLELNKNVFIYPTFYVTKGGERYYTGLYPLKPSEVQYLTDDNGKYFLNMKFANGYEVTLPADSVIHWRKDYGVNDYFGGSAFGGDDNAGLLTMLQRYDQLTQSIAKALECSCQINAVVKYNSYTDDDKMKAQREKFEADLQANKSGVLYLDLKNEFDKIPRDVKLVDAETLKFFHDTILRANGTSLAILNGDYSKTQKEAYYEHALEADIKSLAQAMSRIIFTDREASFGNEIQLYPNEIQFMSMKNRIAFAQIAMPAGALMKDEFRELFGFAPLPNGQGQVIAQGYNNLLDDNNNNTLSDKGGQNENE